jgi:hypothetical protein
MSASWTIKEMKKWYAMLSIDFTSSKIKGYYGTRRDHAEGLREAMMSKKPNDSREYISSWFELISTYYDERSDDERQEDRSDDNQMLMDLFHYYARAISCDKLREDEVVDAMQEYFRNTPVPVHPYAKDIEKLRLFREKQDREQKQHEKGRKQKLSSALSTARKVLQQYEEEQEKATARKGRR